MTLVALMATLGIYAQGWPANYDGVMLQGFYWDSYRASKWFNLEAQADDLAPYFSLVWIPQSANCGSGRSMGYDDLYWFSNYNSSFGNETQLRSMIKTFKSKGIGTIADVVINHRNTLTSWTDFPVETYKGTTYRMYSTDICHDDDGGSTYNWAVGQSPKLSLSNKYDSGDDWDGMRDLDHYSSNVQSVVKAYLDMLLNDFGYAGLRYDMVKGYAGMFTGIYNTALKPRFSVGEYWDGNVNTVKAWINATKVNGGLRLPRALRRARPHRFQLERQGKGRTRQRRCLPPLCGELCGKPRHRVSVQHGAARPYTQRHACRQRLHPRCLWHALCLLQALAGIPHRHQDDD